jgi:hypothetical protein
MKQKVSVNIPPHFGEEFRATGSAFGSTNAMVARSLIHDS